MKVDVLGLGESVKSYFNMGNITVGVNDIFKYHPVDFLFVVDRPHRFKKERLQTIINSKPEKFCSQLEDWSSLVDNFELIELGTGRCNLNEIGSRFPHSNNSTFVAVVAAYKMGATEINIFGADFNDHPSLNVDTVLKDFKKLFEFLQKKGVKINVTSISRLKKLL